MKKLIDFTVTENKRLNHDTILLVLHSDELPEIQPGQFVNVRVDHSPSTFLRRPISVHDVDESRGLLYLFIKIVGCGTSTLGELQIGDKVNVMLLLVIIFLSRLPVDLCLSVVVVGWLPCCICPGS